MFFFTVQPKPLQPINLPGKAGEKKMKITPTAIPDLLIIEPE
jgi:hypothetical protein